MQDHREVIEQLNNIEGLSEVAQVTTYSGYWGTDEVRIEVHDRGNEDPYRYTVVAKTVDADPPRMATTNGDNDLRGAIATTHWYQLNAPQ